MVLPAAAQARTLIVPDQYPGIQQAVTAAGNGDMVLVRPGIYQENIAFDGKAITVVSEFGPGVTIIDGSNPDDPSLGSVVRFTGGEDSTSVLRGFTLRSGSGTLSNGTAFGGGVYCHGASPIITGNVIELNSADAGGGVGCQSLASPTLYRNLILGNGATDGAGVFCVDFSSPILANNVIAENTAINWGGGVAAIFHSAPELRSSTLTGNQALEGGGFFCLSNSLPYITNSILWENDAVTGKEAAVASSSLLTVTYSDVQGGSGLVHVEAGSGLTWGAGMIDADPSWISGPDGDWYLSQMAAGQPDDSPCLNVGSNPPWQVCFSVDLGLVCLDELTTRTDREYDAGWADMGYHFESDDGAGMISALLQCAPASGTLPYTVAMSAMISNNHHHMVRRVAARIDVSPATGPEITNWRSGYTTVPAGDSFLITWLQIIPDLRPLEGENTFLITTEDVTPAPYNLAPYPPAGAGDSSVCTVTGH